MTRDRATPLATLALLAIAVGWGSTFFMLKDLLVRVPVLDYVGVRFAIAALVWAIVLVLAMAVVLYHLGINDLAGFPLISGRAAVFSFFVISGFYMAMVLKTRYTEQALGPKYVRIFYLSRFLRLYPIYAVVLTAFLAVAGTSRSTLTVVGRFSGLGPPVTTQV